MRHMKAIKISEFPNLLIHAHNHDWLVPNSTHTSHRRELASDRRNSGNVSQGAGGPGQVLSVTSGL